MRRRAFLKVVAFALAAAALPDIRIPTFKGNLLGRNKTYRFESGGVVGESMYWRIYDLDGVRIYQRTVKTP